MKWFVYSVSVNSILVELKFLSLVSVRFSNMLLGNLEPKNQIRKWCSGVEEIGHGAEVPLPNRRSQPGVAEKQDQKPTTEPSRSPSPRPASPPQAPHPPHPPRPLPKVRTGLLPLLQLPPRAGHSLSLHREECFSKHDIVFANCPDFISGKFLAYGNTTLGVTVYSDHWRNLRRLYTLEIFSTIRLNMSSAMRRAETNILLRKLHSLLAQGFAKGGSSLSFWSSPSTLA